MTLKKQSTTLWMLLIMMAAYVSPMYATPGENKLQACVNNACPNVPMGIKEIAQMKAAELIDTFYQRRAKNDGFNGTVMIAKDGIPLYSAAFGYGNYAIKDTLTLQSPIQLASVAKTFTSTAVLMMVEQGYFSLDDTLQKFFPEFPYRGITVGMLLSHRSGLPDYIYWDRYFVGTDVTYLSNQKVVELFCTKKPAVRCSPDRMFIYCNSNYALLASIVETVSGKSFRSYMHDNIFGPLGMNNTYVYSCDDSVCSTISYESKYWREWKNGMYDGVVGDKGIYSSAEDMLKWDNALRGGLLISDDMTAEAYKPRSLDRYSFAKEREKNYGYGWRMTKQADKTYTIYHNGFWHGSNNVFARDLDDGYTVIVLGNKSNNNNYWTGPVWDILNQLKSFDNLAEVQ